MMGPITLANDVASFTTLQLSTFVVIAFAILVLFTTLKQSTHSDVFPVSVTNELKGLGILTVVFAHFAYMKVTNADFLFPLSIIAGVGVDLFLFMSGFFPVKNDQALIAVTGTLSMVVGFYFGATFKEIINKNKEKKK